MKRRHLLPGNRIVRGWPRPKPVQIEPLSLDQRGLSLAEFCSALFAVNQASYRKTVPLAEWIGREPTYQEKMMMALLNSEHRLRAALPPRHFNGLRPDFIITDDPVPPEKGME